jgi:CheY-like chemotaxis protein
MRKGIALLVLTAFLTNTFVPYSHAQQALMLPQVGARVELSAGLIPALLKGVKVYPREPFRLDFILDRGDTDKRPLSLEAKGEMVQRLIKYFLAALTVPEKDLWVNLSPYEKDRIVPEAFGQTEMGRDLLAQDYILKQITASIIYPEGQVGKEFWAKIYAQAQEKFGTTDIPVDTFNKVWIVADKAAVFENKDAAFVVESRLKVMLESDYVAASRSGAVETAESSLAKEVLRGVVIPVLEKEVNEGAHFAPLRQIYSSLILATWFKEKIKQTLLGRAYVDQKKIVGVSIEDKAESEKIWARYVEAFKKGTFNFIKEERDPVSDEMIARKYFSGGANIDLSEKLDRFNDKTSLPKDFSTESSDIIQVQGDPILAPGTGESQPTPLKELQESSQRILQSPAVMTFRAHRPDFFDAHVLPFLKVDGNDPVKENIFYRVLQKMKELSSEEILWQMDEVLKLPYKEKGLHIYDDMITFRELFLHPTQGAEDLIQALTARIPAFATGEKISQIEKRDGKELAQQKVEHLYLTFLAMEALGRGDVPLFELTDVQESSPYYQYLISEDVIKEGKIYPGKFSDFLSFSDLLIQMLVDKDPRVDRRSITKDMLKEALSRKEKVKVREAILNYISLIRALKASSRVWAESFDEERKAPAGRLEDEFKELLEASNGAFSMSSMVKGVSDDIREIKSNTPGYFQSFDMLEQVIGEIPDDEIIYFNHIKNDELKENSRLVALSEGEISRLQASYPHYDWRKAATVLWPELVREREQKIETTNHRIYFANQVYVRRALLLMMAKLLAHELSDQDFITGMQRMHIALLTQTGVYRIKGSAALQEDGVAFSTSIAGHVSGSHNRGEKRLVALKAMIQRLVDPVMLEKTDHDIVTDIGRFYADLFQWGRLGFFPRANHSWCMQIVNMMLRLYGFEGIAHGHIDKKPPQDMNMIAEQIIRSIKEANPDLSEAVDALIAAAVRVMPRAGNNAGDWKSFNEIIERLGLEANVEVAVVGGRMSGYEDIPIAHKVILDHDSFGVSADELGFQGLQGREAVFLKHLLDNVVVQHVRDGLALVVKEKYQGYHKISVIDNGHGFLDKDNRSVPVARAVSFNESLGVGGKDGIGLTQALRHGADFTLIDTVSEWAVIEKGRKDEGFSIIRSGVRVKAYGTAIEGYFLTGAELLKPFVQRKVRNALLKSEVQTVNDIKKIFLRVLGGRDRGIVQEGSSVKVLAKKDPGWINDVDELKEATEKILEAVPGNVKGLLFKGQLQFGENKFFFQMGTRTNEVTRKSRDTFFVRVGPMMFLTDDVYQRLDVSFRDKWQRHLIRVDNLNHWSYESYTFTTMLALLSGDLKGKRIIDAGAGRGFLSLLAAKLGAAQMVLIDMDEHALKEARINFELNGIKNVYYAQGEAADLNNEEQLKAFFLGLPRIDRETAIISNIGRWAQYSAGNNTVIQLIPMIEEVTGSRVSHFIAAGYTEHNQLSVHASDEDQSSLVGSGFYLQGQNIVTGFMEKPVVWMAVRGDGTKVPRKKVLVVDNRSGPREFLRTTLSEMYDVQVAISGPDALNQLSQEEFDAVVSDVDMPGLDGLELAKKFPGTPFILHTNASGDLKAGSSNIQAVIVKEYATADEVLKALKEALPSDRIDKGGIDLTREQMSFDVKSAGHGVQFNFDPATVERFEKAIGFMPVIMDMYPMTIPLPTFLGLSDNTSAQETRMH